MPKSFLVYFILSSIVAINLSALSLALQINLIDTSTTIKTISWIVTACSWCVVYVCRNR
jgi:hypothetical protein